MSEITAYPLCWPHGWRRSKPFQRSRAQFKHAGRELSIENGVARIREELRRMGISLSSVIISTDLILRNDGLPLSRQATGHIDPGAAVYWQDGKATRAMAIDRYDRIADNLGAIAATIEAMRAIERHGGAEILDRAFTGFAALPNPAREDLPHNVLGVDEGATPAEIEYAYKRLAAQHHPDKGGSTASMARINAARDTMLAARS